MSAASINAQQNIRIPFRPAAWALAQADKRTPLRWFYHLGKIGAPAGVLWASMVYSSAATPSAAVATQPSVGEGGGWLLVGAIVLQLLWGYLEITEGIERRRALVVAPYAEDLAESRMRIHANLREFISQVKLQAEAPTEPAAREAALKSSRDAICRELAYRVQQWHGAKESEVWCAWMTPVMAAPADTSASTRPVLVRVADSGPPRKPVDRELDPGKIWRLGGDGPWRAIEDREDGVSILRDKEYARLYGKSSPFKAVLSLAAVLDDNTPIGVLDVHFGDRECAAKDQRDFLMDGVYLLALFETVRHWSVPHVHTAPPVA